MEEKKLSKVKAEAGLGGKSYEAGEVNSTFLFRKTRQGHTRDSIELFVQLCYAELGQIPLPEEFIELTLNSYLVKTLGVRC